MPEEDFTVTVGTVAGPLDLILRLVEERKMLVNDISLAQISDSFVAHMQSFEGMPLDQVAQFLVVAATLLLMKSRSLLPDLTITKEEQTDIEDLERRLRIYKRVKEEAVLLRRRLGKTSMHLGAPRPQPIHFSPPRVGEGKTKELSLPALLQAARSLLMHLPRFVRHPETLLGKVVNLEHMMTTILGRLEHALSFRLQGRNHRSNDPSDKVARLNIIVGFLALLELARRGAIALRQTEHFDDIEVETQQFGVPHYS